MARGAREQNLSGTHGAFDDILAGAKPELRAICRSLRDTITSLHHGFVEIVWPRQRIASFGVGPRKMTEHYAYIGVQGTHVNLGFYHGASLADRTALLEGNGKKLRHIKFHSVSEANGAAVAALLRRAIADRKRRGAGARLREPSARRRRT
jgi:hypothetical protein